MQTMLMALVCLLLTACASTHPQNATYWLSTPPHDAFTCVVKVLGEMDYTIRESDRSSGHVVAEGSEVLFTASVEKEVTHPVLTVNVLPAEGDGSTLQVTREGVEEETVRELRNRCGR